MAKATGLIDIEGTLGKLTFYKSQDGQMIKRKGGMSGKRIANDPKLFRIRENIAEFTTVAQAGKFLRNAIKDVLKNASDNRVVSRLAKALHNVKDCDSNSDKGKRQISIGLATPEGKSKLMDFDFNKGAILSSILSRAIQMDQATGVLTMTDLIPFKHLVIPDGATHVTFWRIRTN